MKRNCLFIKPLFFIIFLFSPFPAFAQGTTTPSNPGDRPRPVVGGQQPLQTEETIPPHPTTVTSPAPADEWRGYNRPIAITVSKGKVYVLNSGNNTVTVRKLDGSAEQTISFTMNEIGGATDIAVDSRGRLVLAGAGQPYLIKVFTKTGARANSFGGDGEIGVYQTAASPSGEANRGWFNVVVDRDDNIYASDSNNNRIVKISKTGSILGSYTRLSGREANYKLASDAASGTRLFIAESSSAQGSLIDTIKSLRLDQFGSGNAATIVSGISPIWNIYIKHNLYVLQGKDQGSNIRTYTRNGQEVSVLAVGPFVDVAADKDGSIYGVDQANNKVIKYRP